MADEPQNPAAAHETIGQLIDELQALRASAGDVSYGEIAARIVRRRTHNGVPAGRTQIARSTVYDAFRADRRRLNPSLIGEIVMALGCSEAEAAQWRERCIVARPAARNPVEEGVAPIPAAEQLPAPELTRTTIWSRLPPPRPDWFVSAALIAASVGLNLFGTVLVLKYNLPVFLDMIGTAVVAFCVGPLAAVVVAIATSALASLATYPAGFVWVLVSITGALVWGFGIHRWNMARGPGRFFALTLLSAVACTIVAVPVGITVFDGRTEHILSSEWFADLQSAGTDMWFSGFVSNVGASLPDKLISSYLALWVAVTMANSLSKRMPAVSAGRTESFG